MGWYRLSDSACVSLLCIVTDATYTPVVECDSLADGDHRRQREDGRQCECKDGWDGINCNGQRYPSNRISIVTDESLQCVRRTTLALASLFKGNPPTMITGLAI